MSSPFFRYFLATVSILALIAVAGCAGKEPRAPIGVMDTPEHHYRLGMRFLDSKEAARAIQSFDKALELDPDYGPALAGKGLAKAMQGDDEGLKSIRKGEREAGTPEQELRALIARIRAYTSMTSRKQMSPDDLVDESEDTFDDAMDIIEDHPRLETPELYYYQGEVYLQALRLERAEEMYGRVLRLGRGMEDQAKKRWEIVQKVRRAAPQTHVGERIALVESISRAEMAALLVEELEFQRFLDGPKTAGTFQAPRNPSEQWRSEQGARMVDMAGHPLAAAVEVVTSYGIRGLQPYANNRFQPDKDLAKAEVAMILEDILVRATNDPSLATRYIGQSSPFSDLRADHPAFNAAMLTTTRGLLQGDVRSGGFAPNDTVPGVDAVLAIKKLREELRVF
jgi:tetratricopeptide (TPR) repeat protein